MAGEVSERLGMAMTARQKHGISFLTHPARPDSTGDVTITLLEHR